MSRTLTKPQYAFLSAALSFGTLTGCAPATRTQPDVIAPRVDARQATVTVHNQQPADMRIFISLGNVDYRLGLAPAMSSIEFKIPRVIPTPAEIRFSAKTVSGDESQSSEPVSVSAAEAVEFTIGQTRVITSLFVRPTHKH